ncbi:MAG: 7TM-DISM domain-containing protein [Sulfurimonas sp.]|nr:7TM-DISM domain-containing protein [Sulfurimonas sp.]
MYFNYKILIFLLSFTVLRATQIINIDYSELKKENFTLEYVVDTKASLTNKNIQNQVFHPISNCNSLGYTINPIWIKLKIENTTKLNKNIFIHNDLAYFSKIISIYEYQNNRLFDQNIYTIQNKNNNSLLGSTFVYPLNLQAYTTKTLYFKIEPFTMNLFNFKIYDEKNHIHALINKNILANIIVIILFTLAFYNALLFILTKNKIFFLLRFISNKFFTKLWLYVWYLLS